MITLLIKTVIVSNCVEAIRSKNKWDDG